MKIRPNIGRVLCRRLSETERKKLSDFIPRETRVILAEVLEASAAPGDEELGTFDALYSYGDIVILDEQSTYKMEVKNNERLIVFEDDILGRLDIDN